MRGRPAEFVLLLRLCASKQQTSKHATKRDMLVICCRCWPSLQEALRHAIEQDPSLLQQHPELQSVADKAEAEALKAKGNAAFSAGKLQEAADLFSRCIELDGGNHIYWSNRAAARTGLKEYKAAVRDAARCTELAPRWAKGWSRLGAAYFGLEDYSQASSWAAGGAGAARPRPGMHSSTAAWKIRLWVRPYVRRAHRGGRCRPSGQQAWCPAKQRPRRAHQAQGRAEPGQACSAPRAAMHPWRSRTCCLSSSERQTWAWGACNEPRALHPAARHTPAHHMPPPSLHPRRHGRRTSGR